MFCSALMLIFGILALVKGEFKITSGRMVSGDMSRVLGLILLAGVGGSVLLNHSAVQVLAFVIVVVIGLICATPVSKASKPAAAEQVDD